MHYSKIPVILTLACHLPMVQHDRSSNKNAVSMNLIFLLDSILCFVYSIQILFYIHKFTKHYKFIIQLSKLNSQMPGNYHPMVQRTSQKKRKTRQAKGIPHRSSLHQLTTSSLTHNQPTTHQPTTNQPINNQPTTHQSITNPPIANKSTIKSLPSDQSTNNLATTHPITFDLIKPRPSNPSQHTFITSEQLTSPSDDQTLEMPDLTDAESSPCLSVRSLPEPCYSLFSSGFDVSTLIPPVQKRSLLDLLDQDQQAQTTMTPTIFSYFDDMMMSTSLYKTIPEDPVIYRYKHQWDYPLSLKEA